MPDMFDAIKQVVKESSAEARARSNKPAEQVIVPVTVAAPITAVAAPPVEMKPEGKAASVTFKASRVIADAADPTVIIGIGAVAGNLDLDNETLSQKALTQMAHDFCTAEKRTFKSNHDQVISAALVETWVGAPIYKLTDGSLKVVKATETVPDGAAFAGISNEELSHWFIAVRPEDQTLVAKAARGEMAFSWAAWAEKEVS